MKDIKFRFISKINLMSPPYFVLALTGAFLPVFFAICYHIFSFSQLKEQKEAALDLAFRVGKNEKLENRKQSYLERYAKADPHFLVKEMESLPLMQKEGLFLERALKFHAFENCDAMKDRLAFLLEQNHLRFKEIDRKKIDFLEETVEKQMNPVEVDMDDIQRIVQKIEGQENEKKPQLFFKEFELKKQSKNLSEIFTLQTEIVKREVK